MGKLNGKLRLLSSATLASAGRLVPTVARSPFQSQVVSFPDTVLLFPFICTPRAPTFL